jgi:predicted phosphohydrolase
MRICFTSDLHVVPGRPSVAIVDALRDHVSALEPDVFILGGDISAKLEVLDWVLDCFSPLPCLKLFVAGNHDVWIESRDDLFNGNDSGKKYRELIPQVSQRNGFTFLGKAPCFFRETAFIGTMGWYDYSLRSRKYDGLIESRHYRAKRYGGGVWNDVRFAVWLCDDALGEGHVDPGVPIARKSDEEVAMEMKQALVRQLHMVRRSPSQRTIVVTHHLPYREMVNYQNRLPWDFFCAYMGSEVLGEVMRAEDRITHILCGHSHRKGVFQIGDKVAVKSPIGYPREWGGKGVKQVVQESTYCVEV